MTTQYDTMCTLIDIIHQSIVGNYKIGTLEQFFNIDDVTIQLAIDNSEILSDRYMVCVLSEGSSATPGYFEEKIIEKPLTAHEKKVSYIYRHLYKYGNTITTYNPSAFRKNVNLLGIDFSFRKKIDEKYATNGKKAYYILTKI